MADAVLVERAAPSIADLIDDPMRARELTSDEASALLISLAPVEKALQLVALTPQNLAPTPDSARHAPTYLTLDEAAERARKSRRWMRDHWREIAGAKKVGRDTVFDAALFEKWLRRC